MNLWTGILYKVASLSVTIFYFIATVFLVQPLQYRLYPYCATNHRPMSVSIIILTIPFSVMCIIFNTYTDYEVLYREAMKYINKLEKQVYGPTI